MIICYITIYLIIFVQLYYCFAADDILQITAGLFISTLICFIYNIFASNKLYVNFFINFYFFIIFICQTNYLQLIFCAGF